MLRLPTRNEAALIALAAAILLFASWQRRGEKIAALEAQLAARPLVESTKKVEQDKTIKRGAVHTVAVTVTAPDGTKTKTTTIDAAPVDTTVVAKIDETRKETPVVVAEAAAPWRYAGVLVDPFTKTRLVGLRGSVTLWDHLEIGLSGRCFPRAIQGDVGIRW